MINGKTDKVIENLLNRINKKGNKCFQCDVTVPLNREEIGNHPEIIKKN